MKIAIVTDSNSGITQRQAEQEGIFVVPMPFMINGQTYYEDIDLTQEQFYEKLAEGADISTSQPTPESVTGLWDRLLEEYDQIVHIPMSSGLSGSCQTAMMLAQDYEGKVFVVNNHRISVTQRQSALDAKRLAEEGKTGEEIAALLYETRYDSSIYITVDTLKYLKKGGRVTPAPAEYILRMATENGYRLMGEDGGRLEAGRKADLITIKMLQPHLYPTGNTVNTLLECVTAGDVCDSIVNGKLLMKDRKVLTLDEEKILAEAAEYMDREMKKTGEDTAAERKKVS